MYYNNYYPNMQASLIQQAQGLKGRPVSSLEEVRAAQIDFDGSLFIFPDISNKKIYTKQIGVDGIMALNMYELKPIPNANSETYVTREEFERAVTALQEALALHKEEPSKVQEAPKEAPQQKNFNF